jgi:uncharacterized protein (TIGR03083 family)
VESRLTKDGLVTALRERRAELDALLEGVPPDAACKPGDAGGWSVKDVVVHLAWHEGWFADRLREALRGEAYRPGELDRMGFDERNELLRRRDRDRPWEEVLVGSREGFRRLVEGLEVQPEAFLVEPQRFEGAEEPVVVGELLRSNVVDHYGEHLPQLRAWLTEGRG